MPTEERYRITFDTDQETRDFVDTLPHGTRKRIMNLFLKKLKEQVRVEGPSIIFRMLSGDMQVQCVYDQEKHGAKLRRIQENKHEDVGDI